MGPGRHLLVLIARQIPELLPADCVERPEDHYLLVVATLEDRLESGAERNRRFTGTGATAERDDADLVIEQDIERDALLSASAMQTKGGAIATDQHDLLIWGYPSERAPLFGVQDDSGVAWMFVAKRVLYPIGFIEGVDQRSGNIGLDHSGPTGCRREFVAILLGCDTE